MNIIKSLTFLVVTMVYGASCLNEIPEYLHICKTSEPDVQKCFLNSVLALKPYLAKGVPEHKIPRIEPLILKELLVSEPTGPNQGVKISANNIKVYGCSDFNIRNLEIDFDNGFVNFELLLKHLYIEGEYGIDGRILLLPVHGSGKVIGNFTNCVGICKLKNEIVKRDDGEEYINMKNMNIRIKVGNGNIHLYNLFGGDGVLGDVINNVINQNFDTFSRELFPALERELSRQFLTLTNNIVSQYTYAQLLPKS